MEHTGLGHLGRRGAALEMSGGPVLKYYGHTQEGACVDSSWAFAVHPHALPEILRNEDFFKKGNRGPAV